jgi:methyl halide transferase
MHFNSNYWNNRYLDEDAPWDLGGPSPALVKYFDNLIDKNLRILIPGAGNAYEAEYLFRNGFTNVTVLDFSKKALDNFSARCPEFPKEKLIEEDFFLHSGTYDLIVEQTFFCALDPKLRKAYVEKMQMLLTVNGKLFGLLFDDAALKGNPPFGGTKEEYIRLFGTHFQLEKCEICPDSIPPRKNRELIIEFKKTL